MTEAYIFLYFQIIFVMLGISQYICGCFSVPFEPIRQQNNMFFLMDELSVLGELILWWLHSFVPGKALPYMPHQCSVVFIVCLVRLFLIINKLTTRTKMLCDLSVEAHFCSTCAHWKRSFVFRMWFGHSLHVVKFIYPVVRMTTAKNNSSSQ